MIPATFTLLVAATSTVLSANALPVLSGFFASPATPASNAVVKRDLTDGEFAQGTNAFFRTLLLEDVCTPGQVACINNNTATCSPEANWEITPCPSSTTCLAIPVDSSDSSSSNSVIVKCTTTEVAVAAIEQAGGSQDVAVDYSITSAPFNATVADVPSNNSTDTTSTDVPTSTDSFTDVPTATDTEVPSATCTPEDGDNDGDNSGDDGSDDGSDGSDPTDTTELPTGTEAATTPTGVCTDEPSEPTETEYITVIAFPDPSVSGSFTFSTIEPTDAETITLPDETPTDSTTDTSFPTETDTTTDTSLPTGTDAVAYPAPTDSNTDTSTETTPCVHPDPQQTSTDVPTDTNTDIITTATGTDSATTGAPTSTGPVPDINTIGTFEIPATTTASTPILIRRSGRMQRKVRRS